MNAVCVDPDTVHQVWPRVSHLLRRAYEHGDDTFEIGEADVLSGNALLWLAVDGGIKGAAISKIWASPKQKICSVLACSGENLSEWRDCLLAIEAYAKAEGCAVVRLSGRRGWKRVFTDYSEPWITLEKRL